ncbi:MAG: LysM peptidoglycan-binding domain-containing protein [Candidatus Omnitrophica bacterium]|nr:LysM peptidoglycan-binding domain-containing protein [Candidatus Omnitrophota bacterium]
MKHKDSDFTDQVNSEPEKNTFYEEDYLQRDKKKNPKFGSRAFKIPETIPFSWFGAFVLILIILLILVLGGTFGTVVGFENRLKELEQRVVKFQDIDDKATQVLEQAQAFEQFKDRFDRLEASMTLRMDHVAKGLNDLQKKIAQVRPQKPQVLKPAKVAKKTTKKSYYTVRPGDTLYRISRTHGLTVKKLRILNKLSDKAVIHPGQKLLVGS